MASGTETDKGSVMVVAGIDMVVLTGEDTTGYTSPNSVSLLITSPFDLGWVTTWHELLSGSFISDGDGCTAHEPST